MPGRIIAVCGSPNSGKTTVACKIAETLYRTKRGTVLYVSPDLVIPALAYLFPNEKQVNLHSLGKVLDKTEILSEDVLREVVSVADNYGFLGYISTENKYSYPAITHDKVVMLFNTLTEVADYVIVDCTCAQEDLISSYAKKYAESVVRMITPDLKCIAYYGSNREEFEGLEDTAVTVMSLTEKDVAFPEDEIIGYFGGAALKIPYSREVREAALAGLDTIHDRQFNKVLSRLTTIVAGEAPVPVSAKKMRAMRKQKKREEAELRRQKKLDEAIELDS